MAHLHILICCVLIGFSGVDLCFDSLLFPNPFIVSWENVQQVQNYYQRTRATIIVQVITVLIVLLFLSLLNCLIYRRALKDILAGILFLLFLPYYLFVMEPAEDSCINHSSNSHSNDQKELSEEVIRDGLFKVGVGHVLIIIVASIIALLDLEWSFETIKTSSSSTNNNSTKKQK